ncbi:DUF6176 family protein [Coleofasciculus sp. H7-2]|uniref:DUF6176 family protein n=1 Tax=Coleofasciculus sp. H7-2 TaxID=3351545 RepID=UPI003671A66B
MAETQCLKIRIKPGLTIPVIGWLKNLNNQLDEVRELLRNEGILIESIFLERSKDGDFLILYQKAEDLSKASEAFYHSSSPLALATQKFISETWGDIQPLELVIDFERMTEV